MLSAGCTNVMSKSSERSPTHSVKKVQKKSVGNIQKRVLTLVQPRV